MLGENNKIKFLGFLIFIIFMCFTKQVNSETIHKLTIDKSKFYICENISNYSGSSGVNNNPDKYFQENCKISTNLIGSDVCNSKKHCKLDKLTLERFLDNRCFRFTKTKHLQYFLKSNNKNSEKIEVSYNCR